MHLNSKTSWIVFFSLIFSLHQLHALTDTHSQIIGPVLLLLLLLFCLRSFISWFKKKILVSESSFNICAMHLANYVDGFKWKVYICCLYSMNTFSLPSAQAKVSIEHEFGIQTKNKMKWKKKTQKKNIVEKRNSYLLMMWSLFVPWIYRSIEWSRFWRGSWWNGGGEGHWNVLNVRTSFGTVLRESFDWLFAKQENSRPQQIGKVSKNLALLCEHVFKLSLALSLFLSVSLLLLLSDILIGIFFPSWNSFIWL